MDAARAGAQPAAQRHQAHPAGAPLAVRLVADSRTVALTVGDSGPGIASELAARLFQPFSAGDVRTDRAWAWPSAGKSPKRSAAASAWTNRIERGRTAGLDATVRLPRANDPGHNPP
jgi:two-component system sensor histidine kinase TctE